MSRRRYVLFYQECEYTDALACAGVAHSRVNDANNDAMSVHSAGSRGAGAGARGGDGMAMFGELLDFQLDEGPASPAAKVERTLERATKKSRR